MDMVLPLAHFRLQLEARTPIHFHHYSGSAWRGLFGHALRETACVTGERECRGCLLYRSCVYAYVFETPPPSDARFMRRSTRVPHPFVMTPDFGLRHLAPGETTALDLVLAGKAVDYLPYIVHALACAGERGVGAGDGKYRIRGVEQLATLGGNEWADIFQEGRLQPRETRLPQVPPLPERVCLQFESPLRLRYQNKMLSAENFQFAGLIANLLRRYSMMAYFHGGQEVDLDFRGLVEQARDVQHTAADLQWYKWRRYSSRQHKQISMGGVIGRVEYAAEDIASFWPLLWLGQWLHLGKGTSMGLGRYQIGSVPVESAASQAA